MKKGMKFRIIIGGCSLLLLAACGKANYTADENTIDASSTGSINQAQIKVNMKIYDNTNAVVYSDSNINSSLVLKENQNYRLDLSPSQDVAGLKYALTLTKTSVVGSTPQTIQLQSGSNNFSVPTKGDYSLKLVATASQMLPVTKLYTAAVTCQNPVFSAASLDGSKMTVSGSTNMYTFNASAVVAGANGMAPYTCAWDGTGVGIVDTAFKDCSASSSAFYSNLVGDRGITVVVKDACNTVQSVKKTLNLPYVVPSLGGNVFIHGAVSNATGNAMNDSRVDNAIYLATNVGGNNIVQSSYSGANFTISAAKNYGMASSVAYGMKIQVSNLTGSVDVKTMASTLSAATAKLKAITYTTDQAGDAKAATGLSGSSCTLSNQNVKVMFVSGTPCSDGSGTNNKATVEVYGSYVCTGVSNGSGGTITITGSFDGYDTIVDSCSGGGGGGGGVAPINL